MSSLNILIVEGNNRQDSAFFVEAAGATAAACRTPWTMRGWLEVKNPFSAAAGQPWCARADRRAATAATYVSLSKKLPLIRGS